VSSHKCITVSLLVPGGTNHTLPQLFLKLEKLEKLRAYAVVNKQYMDLMQLVCRSHILDVNRPIRFQHPKFLSILNLPNDVVIVVCIGHAWSEG